MEEHDEDRENAPSTAEPRNAFLEEKAFKSRTVLLFGEISDRSAADVIRRLVALDADSSMPIDMPPIAHGLTTSGAKASRWRASTAAL